MQNDSNGNDNGNDLGARGLVDQLSDFAADFIAGKRPDVPFAVLDVLLRAFRALQSRDIVAGYVGAVAGVLVARLVRREPPEPAPPSVFDLGDDDDDRHNEEQYTGWLADMMGQGLCVCPRCLASAAVRAVGKVPQ